MIVGVAGNSIIKKSQKYPLCIYPSIFLPKSTLFLVQVCIYVWYLLFINAVDFSRYYCGVIICA